MIRPLVSKPKSKLKSAANPAGTTKRTKGKIGKDRIVALPVSKLTSGKSTVTRSVTLPRNRFIHCAGSVCSGRSKTPPPKMP